jgi:membrane-bound serine protease (ClpP class)
MKRLRVLSLVALLLGLGLGAAGALREAQPAWAAVTDAPADGAVAAATPGVPLQLAVIDLHGEVNGVMAATFKRRLATALEDGADLVVLDVDTWGGELHAAYEITDEILALPDAVQSVAFVSRKAISAGAMISLACNTLAMAPNTRIGDCEPIMATSEGMKTGPEKIKSPLRSDFRNFAKRSGYPEALCEAMVDKDHKGIERVHLAPDGADLFTESGRSAAAEAATVMYVGTDGIERWPLDKRDRIISREVVLEAGLLLTMNQPDAVDLGFCDRVVRDVDALVAALEAETGATIDARPYGETAWESVIVFLTGPMHGFLMFVGVLGLMIEFYHPGLIVPGTVGLACLALAFFGSSLLGLVDWIDVTLVIVGIGLVLLEVLVIPGFGFAGILGIVAIAAGLLFSVQSFTIPDPQNVFEVEIFKTNLKWFGYGVVGLVLTMAVVARLLPRSPWLNQLVLTGTQQVEDGYSVASPDRVALIGRAGLTVTALRPSGKIDVAGELVDAVAEGTMIDRGVEVEIIETDSNRVLVRRRSGEPGEVRA